MSPEQAKGKTVDKRADIWAFGCVLFEYLTARRAFRGDTITETVAAILKSEPDWTLLAVDTPPFVRSLLRQCLQKDTSLRLRDIGDVRVEMFLVIAKGSCAEVRAQLYVALDVGLISKEQFDSARGLAEETSRIVSGLRKPVATTSAQGKQC